MTATGLEDAGVGGLGAGPKGAGLGVVSRFSPLDPVTGENMISNLYIGMHLL